MSDQDQPMPRANPPFWIALTSGGALFLAGFIVWAAVFGFGGTRSPNEQQASGAPAQQQTTGQAPAEQPMQQPAQQEKK